MLLGRTRRYKGRRLQSRRNVVDCASLDGPWCALETDDFDRMARAFIHWSHRLDQLSGG
jgi:hypothetical protein